LFHETPTVHAAAAVGAAEVATAAVGLLLPPLPVPPPQAETSNVSPTASTA